MGHMPLSLRQMSAFLPASWSGKNRTKTDSFRTVRVSRIDFSQKTFLPTKHCSFEPLSRSGPSNVDHWCDLNFNIWFCVFWESFLHASRALSSKNTEPVPFIFGIQDHFLRGSVCAESCAHFTPEICSLQKKMQNNNDDDVASFATTTTQQSTT